MGAWMSFVIRLPIAICDEIRRLIRYNHFTFILRLLRIDASIVFPDEVADCGVGRRITFTQARYFDVVVRADIV